jgi:hypothetical protein
MKKILPILLVAGIPASYAGGISHSISSSVQLEAVSAGSIAEKVSSSYSISGSGVTTLDSDDANSIGGFGGTTDGVPSITFPDSVAQTTAGEAFNYTTSYIEGDQTPSAAATVGEIPNFSNITSTEAASVGTADIGLDNHTITLTPGTGTGVTLTGSFVTDLQID